MLLKKISKTGKIATLIEFLDITHKVAPYIFADPHIGGGAYINPDDEQELTPFHELDGRVFAGMELTALPDKVQSIVESLEERRIMAVKRPGDGWLSANEIKQLTGIPPRLLSRAIRRLSTVDGEWFESNSVKCRRRDDEESIRLAVHYSPEIVHKIKEIVDMPEPPPKGWSTEAQLSVMYGISAARINSAVARAVQDRQNDYGVFAVEKGSANTRLFYSPDIEKRVAEIIGVDYLNGKPPNGWASREDITKIFGQRLGKETLESVLRSTPSLRRTHVRTFDVADSGEQNLHVSPRVINAMQRHTSPPPTWSNTTDLRLQLDVEASELEGILAEIRSKDADFAQNNSRICRVGNRNVRYFSPKFIAAAKKRVVRRETRVTIIEIDIPDTVEPAKFIGTDSLPANKRAAVIPFLERIPDLVHRHTKKVVTEKGLQISAVDATVARSLGEISTRLLDVDDSWYTATELADIFDSSADKIREKAEYILRRRKSPPPMRKIIVGDKTEHIYSEEFAAIVIELMKL